MDHSSWLARSWSSCPWRSTASWNAKPAEALHSGDAMDAGSDCTETMKQEKMRKYEHCMGEPAQQNIAYVPATFSC